MSRYTFVLLCCVLLLSGCPPQRRPIFYKLSKYAHYAGAPKGVVAPLTTNPPDRPYIIIGLVSFFERFDRKHNRFFDEDDSLEVIEKLGEEAIGYGADAISLSGAVPVSYLDRSDLPAHPYGRGDSANGWISAYAIKWADEGDVEALPAGADPRPVADSLVPLGKRFQPW